MSSELTLRERTRRAVRDEIVDAAMNLFLSHGFEATTVEQIARAGGISRRSYFRYFANKDEALSEAFASIGHTIAQALAACPQDEAPWDALRSAFNPLVEQASAGPSAKAFARLMLERPSFQQAKDTAWLAEIASVLEKRLPIEEAPLRARSLVAAAIACLHAAQEQWLDPHNGRDLGPLFTIAMSAIRPLHDTQQCEPHGLPRVQ